MAYSIQREVSDGTLQTLTLRIAYFKKSHIFVYVDDKIADGSTGRYSWVWDGDRIRLNKVVPVGIEVMIRRKTPMDAPFHNFRQGAVFKDVTMDENFIQQLYINQENVEGLSATDFYRDLDLHNYRMKNVGTAISDADAVSLGQYRADALGANQYRILAEGSKVAAKASEVAANAAQLAAKASEDNSKVSEVKSKAYADNANTSSTVATAAKGDALASANAAKVSEAAAKVDADRAQYWADRIDVVEIDKRITVVDTKAASNSNRIGVVEATYASVRASTGDLNTVSKLGTVPWAPTTANIPLVGSYGVVFTIPSDPIKPAGASDQWLTQIASQTDNGALFIRRRTNESPWTPWARVFTSANMTFEY